MNIQRIQRSCNYRALGIYCDIIVLQSIRQTYMRQIRAQRPGLSVHGNKENQNQQMNLPTLKNNGLNAGHGPQKQSLTKNQYRINLNHRSKNQRGQSNSKTYLHLGNQKRKKSKLALGLITKNRLSNMTGMSKMTISTARIQSENSQILEDYYSSRGDKPELKKRKLNQGRSKEISILSKHQINNKMRAKMVDWLLEISEAYKFKNETLSCAIFLMDQYFKKCQRSLTLTELHVIGVTVIFMAAKYQQVHPLTLKTVYKQIGHYKISTKQIIAREAQILETLDFCLKRRCPFQSIQQILYYFRNLNQEKVSHLTQLAKDFLQITIFDLGIFYQEEPQIIAKSCILAAIRTICQPQNLALYDQFSQMCIRKGQYQKIQQISSRIILVCINFENEYGSLDNIKKIVKKHQKSANKKMISSCAL